MTFKTEIRTVNFDDLIFPEPIYKYRDWNNEYHKTIVTALQVFMSPPSSFDDKLDCKNPIRYDLLSKEQIWQWLYLQSKQHNNTFSSDLEHKNFTDNLYPNSIMHDKVYLKEMAEKDFLKLDKRVGILSLTANPLNEEMWKMYSNNHYGFCVGFNAKIMFKFLGGGCDVTYVETLPDIMPYPFHSRDAQWAMQVYHKLKKWEKEEEYRTEYFYEHNATIQDRTRILPVNCYKEIIFGARMPDEFEKEIIQIAKSKIPHLQFKKAILTNNKITIIDY